MSINHWDTKLSILVSLLLERSSILSWFFFSFLVILSNFLIISVVTEKIKAKLALAIPTGVSITVVKKFIYLIECSYIFT